MTGNEERLATFVNTYFLIFSPLRFCVNQKKAAVVCTELCTRGAV